MRSGGKGLGARKNSRQAYNEFLDRISLELPLEAHEIQKVFLPETCEQEFCLLESAHLARVNNLGQEVHVRGIIEFSNYCRQDCLYCGLRRSNGRLTRYRMSPSQIIEAASDALRVHKFGTFVLQSGEDPGYSAEALAEVVSAVKQMGPAVTLSVGQRTYEDYELWREAGADRFLLKLETSDYALFRKLKPTTTLNERLQCLYDLRSLGYQIGTGIILGLPGQTQKSVIDDFRLVKQLDPEMVSIGPFISHPDTPLGIQVAKPQESNPTDLIRAVLRATAVSRLLVPLAHIPATTALGVIGKHSREWVKFWKKYIQAGLSEQGSSSFVDLSWLELAQDWNDPRGLALLCGANVIMPDVTPKRFRDSYDLYPGKASSDGEELKTTVENVKNLIARLRMSISPGRGDSPKPPFQF